MRFFAMKRRDRPGRSARRRLLWTEMLERRDVPAAGPLGMNISTLEFVDMIQQSGGFYAANPGDPNFSLDARDWPTADANVVVFDDRVNMPWNGPDPNAAVPDMSGTYHLSFTGQANVWSYPASVQNQVYDPTTNTTTADVVEPTGNPFLMLGFSNTQRTPDSPVDSGVASVKLIRPGYDPNTTQVFTDRYLAALAPFNTMRYMDATDTNGYGPEWGPYLSLNWSQRALPTDASQYDGNHLGVAWEDLIQLANTTHTNMWINIPGPATDDYVRQLANLIKNGDTVDGISYPGLDPGLKVYVEWSNEVWGGINSTYSYNISVTNQEVQSGNSVLTNDGLSTSALPDLLFRHDLERTAQIANIFQDVFNDPNHDTVRPVVVWQEANYYPYLQNFPWFEANFGAPSRYFYGIGNANYYSPSDYSSVDNLLNSLTAASVAEDAITRDFTTVASYYGLKNVAYEGGPGIGGTGDAGQVGLAALRDPRMAQIVAQSYIDWFANGGDQAAFYSGPYDIWAPQWPWAAAELGQANNPAQSPKYAGLLNVANSSPVPVTAGVPVSGSSPTMFDAGTDTLGQQFNGSQDGYWLLWVSTPGTYDLSVLTSSGDTGSTPMHVSTSGDAGLGPAVTIPQGGGITDLGTVILHAGLNTLYVHTPSTSGGFWANAFTLTPI